MVLGSSSPHLGLQRKESTLMLFSAMPQQTMQTGKRRLTSTNNFNVQKDSSSADYCSKPIVTPSLELNRKFADLSNELKALQQQVNEVIFSKHGVCECEPDITDPPGDSLISEETIDLDLPTQTPTPHADITDPPGDSLSSEETIDVDLPTQIPASTPPTPKMTLIRANDRLTNNLRNIETNAIMSSRTNRIQKKEIHILLIILNPVIWRISPRQS